jgi:hypothetical protein
VMNNVELAINPSQLIKGINKARIQLFYSNGIQEYFDFEIVKEETKRVIAQRLFRDYDGGFTGDIYAPPKISIPSLYPCWMTKDNLLYGMIKTTEYTRMSLLHYLDIQGVSVAGLNLAILVSFDEGITWKSFINNIWTTVDIANIKTYGMAVATINTITIAQWADIFTATSIDFAVYYNNTLNATSAIYAYNGGAGGQTMTYDYNVPSNVVITSISNTVASYNSCTVYSDVYPNGYVFNGIGSYTALEGERITRITNFCYFVSGGGTGLVSTIYGYTLNAYLKSITVNMTPSPFTGYAFII